jgi:hypothetical protein
MGPAPASGYRGCRFSSDVQNGAREVHLIPPQVDARFTIPIVFTAAADPERVALVASLARPSLQRDLMGF